MIYSAKIFRECINMQFFIKIIGYVSNKVYFLLYINDVL